MSSLKNKKILITGGSRGIGLAIAKRAAKDGAFVAIAAKTTEEHPKLPGTIYTAAKEIQAAGGQALPLKIDIRFEEQIEEAVNKTVKQFDGLDILINNASAISLTHTLDTPAKKFDLMHQINVRATYLTSRAAIPFLKKSDNPHILTLSPPFNLNPYWFKSFCAYTMSKYGMSMCTLGMAEEFKSDKIAINSLWPKTIISTAALNVVGVEGKHGRHPEIVAEAAYRVLIKNSSFTGHFLIDEDFLRSEGITDFSQYRVDSKFDLRDDLFLDPTTH